MRIKSQSIQLPVEALLKQFKDPEVGGRYSLVRNFDLMYIQQGIARMNLKDRLVLLPPLISQIHSLSEQHQSLIFNILLTILPHYIPPPRGTSEDAALSEYFAFDKYPSDAIFLQKWFTKLMLLTSQTLGPESQKTCRGLTPAEYAFLTLGGKKETWNPPGSVHGQKLKMAKMAVLRFLSTGAWTDDKRYLPSLVAYAHSINEDSKVMELAEEIFKRSAAGVSLDETEAGETLIQALYEYYFCGEAASNTPPLRWTLRARVISLLAKSKRAVSGEEFGGKLPRVLEVALSTGDDSTGWADVERDRRKLRKEVFTYINWFARVTDDSTIESHGPGMVERLRYFIIEENQRIAGSFASGAAVLPRGYNGIEDSRGLAYEAIGLICRRLFQKLVYEPGLDVLRFLFSALHTSGGTSATAVRNSVQEALGSLLLGFTTAGTFDESVENALADFLVEEIEDDELANETATGSSVQYAAIRFANRGLRFSNVKARWICMLACKTGGQNVAGGGRNELLEESRRGLDPYWYRMLNPSEQLSTGPDSGMDVDTDCSGKVDRYAFPPFAELIDYITSPRPHLSGSHGHHITVHNIPLDVLPIAIDFCRRVLVMEALDNKSKALFAEYSLDPQSFSTTLDTSIATDSQIRGKISTLLLTYSTNSSPDSMALEKLFSIAYDGMLLDIPSCVDIWVELCELAPQDFIGHWARGHAKVGQLSKMIFTGNFSTVGGGGNNDLEKRTLLVKALGSVLAHPECGRSLVQETIRGFHELHGQGGHQAYTAIVALGYILSRLAIRERLDVSLDREVVERSLEIVLNAVFDAHGSEKLLVEAGLQALGELCVFGVLKRDYLFSKANNRDIQSRLDALASKQSMEKAVLAMGCSSLALDPSTDSDVIEREKILSSLYALHESKQLELLFAVGEALSIVAAGWNSSSLARRYLDVHGLPPPHEMMKRAQNAAPLEGVMTTLLGKFATSTKPSLRRATCVWLLSLVESCGALEGVNRRLKDLQAAFRSFLVDRDEFVQETASRGLTLVYEKGDKSMKDELVRSLIASFTGDTKTQTLAGQVSADTQLFEPGTLRTGTSDHGSISTYKDIMSLASEVGDPSLIYRFMSLARHNSLWASRASFGRFGLGNILSSSSTSVDGYLTENPKLYPKLFRYRFDPNPNVRKSMNDIWTALVRDSQSILDKYFDDILEDLLKTIFDREWRVREASCGALVDLLQGRKIARYGAHLERIWGAAFKVMDDIKESVRVAALTLCRVLATSMVRLINVDAGASKKDADLILSHLMPFLLGIQGLEAQAKEVQLFALDTLMKFIKSAGPTLRGYIPDLVEKLLALLSILEPQVVNWLHLNAAKYNLTEDKIDAARLSGVRSSPLMDAIERCLDLLDEATMALLVPRLVKTIRKSVGMPSKVGTSRVLVTLVLRQSILTKPHGGELLKSVMEVILDRNDAVSTSWAVAGGYLCRLCSHDQVLGLVRLAQKFWFENEEERVRALAGEILHDISKRSPDQFNALSSSILPLVFLAKHDISSSMVSTTFSSVWSENTGGTGAVRLYLTEIITLAQGSLTSQRWAIKQAAAMTLADICTSVDQYTTPDQRSALYLAMVAATGGKSWEGKEKILESYVELVGKFVVIEPLDQKTSTEVRKIVMREAKRTNRAYQAHALNSLARYAELFADENLFEDVSTIIENAVQDEDSGNNEGDKMDIDEQDGKIVKSTKYICYLNAIAAISQAFRPKFYSGSEAHANLMKALNLITNAVSSIPTNYEIKTAQASTMEVILSRLKNPLDGATLLKIWEFLDVLSSDRGSEDLRRKVIKGGLLEATRLVSLGSDPELQSKMKGDLKKLIQDERVPMLRADLREALVRLGG